MTSEKEAEVVDVRAHSAWVVGLAGFWERFVDG